MDTPYLINEDSFKIFKQFVQDSSHKMFDDYIGLKNEVKDVEHDQIIGTVFKDRMSFILISGESFNMIFRIFFNSSDFIKSVAESIDMEESEVNDQLIRDFMNEYCNLVAGALKANISEASNQAVGISIPIVTNGFEVWYFGLKRPATHYFFWKLVTENTEAVFSVELEELRGFDQTPFNNLKEEDTSQTEDDIFNF